MDHFGRDVQCRFAGDELDPAPAALLHAAGIVAGQAHAAEQVDLQHRLPLGIVDLEERHRAVDAQVVDQDVDLRARGSQRGGALGRTGIGNHTGGRRRTGLLIDLLQRRFHALRAAPADGDRCPGLTQANGDCQANALGGGGDQGGTVIQIDLHRGDSSGG